MPAAAVPGALSAYPVVLSSSLGLPKSISDYVGQDTNNFAPRVGLAYKISNKTVIRAGFGIYYNVIPVSVLVSINNLPFVVVGTYEQPAGGVPGFTMSNPFPGVGSVPANPSKPKPIPARRSMSRREIRRVARYSVIILSLLSIDEQHLIRRQ